MILYRSVAVTCTPPQHAPVHTQIISHSYMFVLLTANSIHGQRVVRLGKGIPPCDSQEDEQTVKTHRRRMVPNMSFEAQ
jgi:hypothetical protein